MPRQKRIDPIHLYNRNSHSAVTAYDFQDCQVAYLYAKIQKSGIFENDLAYKILSGIFGIFGIFQHFRNFIK